MDKLKVALRELVDAATEAARATIDAAWRVLERAHDLAADLRAHRLFPNRKVFNGAVVSGLTAIARPLLAKTGVDVGPWIVPAAGFITAYFFSAGPDVAHLDDESHEAIDHEERLVRNAEAQEVDERD